MRLKRRLRKLSWLPRRKLKKQESKPRRKLKSRDSKLKRKLKSRDSKLKKKQLRILKSQSNRLPKISNQKRPKSQSR